MSTPAPAPYAPPTLTVRSLAEVEREAIEHALAVCHGNIPRAAALLGVAPSTLYRKRSAWLQTRLT